MGLRSRLPKKGKASTDDSTAESKQNPYQPSMANPKAVPTKPVAVAANNDQPLTTPRVKAEDKAAAVAESADSSGKPVSEQAAGARSAEKPVVKTERSPSPPSRPSDNKGREQKKKKKPTEEAQEVNKASQTNTAEDKQKRRQRSDGDSEAGRGRRGHRSVDRSTDRVKREKRRRRSKTASTAVAGDAATETVVVPHADLKAGRKKGGNIFRGRGPVGYKPRSRSRSSCTGKTEGRRGSRSPTRSKSPRGAKTQRVKREIHSSDAEGGEGADAKSVKGSKKEPVDDAPTAGTRGKTTGKIKHPPMTSWSKEHREVK